MSALAVHGVMTGVDDRRAPVPAESPRSGDAGRAAGPLGAELAPRRTDCTSGSTAPLSCWTCAAERRDGAADLPLRQQSLRWCSDLEAGLLRGSPALQIAGAEPSQFRTGTDEEAEALADTDPRFGGPDLLRRAWGARDRRYSSTRWHLAARCRCSPSGAAFDFHSGHQKEPPRWIQDHGFQWAHRLAAEPRRLAHRYLVLSPRYLGRVAVQRSGRSARVVRPQPPVRNVNYL